MVDKIGMYIFSALIIIVIMWGGWIVGDTVKYLVDKPIDSIYVHHYHTEVLHRYHYDTVYKDTLYDTTYIYNYGKLYIMPDSTFDSVYIDIIPIIR